MSDIENAQKKCLSFLKETHAGKVIYIGIAIENLLKLVSENKLENIEILSTMSIPVGSIKRKLLYRDPQSKEIIDKITFHDAFPTKNIYDAILYFPNPAIYSTDFEEHLKRFKNICKPNGVVLICTEPIKHTTFSMFSTKINLERSIENIFGENSIEKTQEFGEFTLFQVRT